jgi:hypothetical protein
MSNPARFDDIRAAITRRFASGFVSGAEPLFPVQYDNHGFTVPVGIWGRFTIREGTRGNAAVGTAFQRHTGIVYLQIFAKEGTGTKPSNAAAALFGSIFDNQSISETWGDIVFECVTATTIGKDPQGWFQVNASVQYRADVTG